MNRFHLLQSLGRLCVKALSRFICTKEDAWDSLFEKEIKEANNSLGANPICSDVMDTFYYYKHPLPPAHSCDAHTDIDLLTIIPRAYGSAGLEILDWAVGEWVKAESLLSEYQCLVFPGKCMEVLSNEFYLATLHKVVSSPNCVASGDCGVACTGGEMLHIFQNIPALSTQLFNISQALDPANPVRLSTPFLLHAQPTATLDPSTTNPRLAGQPKGTPVEHEALVLKITAATASVTFGGKYQIIAEVSPHP